jgi:hypothetical protein
MSEAQEIERRVARLLKQARAYDELDPHDAAYLIRCRARLWVRTLTRAA